MLKSFLTCLILIFAMLGFNPVFAQAQVTMDQVHLGCALAWDEPTQPDPNDATKMVSTWTDLKGFAHIANKGGGENWDALEEIRKDDPTLRAISCEDFQVNELGVYTVGVRAYDSSLNKSNIAWLTFEVVEQDVQAPDGVMNFCLKGTLNGVPFELGCLK